MCTHGKHHCGFGVFFVRLTFACLSDVGARMVSCALIEGAGAPIEKNLEFNVVCMHLLTEFNTMSTLRERSGVNSSVRVIGFGSIRCHCTSQVVEFGTWRQPHHHMKLASSSGPPRGNKGWRFTAGCKYVKLYVRLWWLFAHISGLINSFELSSCMVSDIISLLL